MDLKICAILIIALCMIQFSMQDDKVKTTAKPATTTVAPATYAAPVWGGYSIK